MRAGYRLTGAAPLRYIGFAGEMPLIERTRTPGAQRPYTEAHRHRLDGEYAIEIDGYVDRQALGGNGLAWVFTVEMPSMDPQTLSVPIKQDPPAQTPAARTGGGRLKFKQMSKEDAAAMAGTVLDGTKDRARPTASDPGGSSRTQPTVPGPTTRNGRPTGGQATPPPASPWAGSYYDKGREAFVRGDWKGAETALREAIRLRADHPGYHRGLAVVLVAQARAADAEAAAREAVKLDGDDARSRHVLGVALFLQQRWADAEKEYREAVRLEPEKGQYHAELGLALHRQGRRDEAIAEGKEAMRLGYQHERIYKELGLTP